jgi:hypothetical protein
MEYDEEPTDGKKLYRVDWKYIDLEKGVDEDYAYVGAASPAEAVDGILGTDFTVREASKEEMEAYVAGYEDGYDIAVIASRMEDLEAGMEIDINDLSEEDL